MIIKDRHILVDRLKKAMILAKADNAGDVFKINRLLMKHTEDLKELEDHMRHMLTDRRMLDAIHAKNKSKEEEAAVHRLRAEVNLWEL